jgi:hypothetical protein
MRILLATTLAALALAGCRPAADEAARKAEAAAADDAGHSADRTAASRAGAGSREEKLSEAAHKTLEAAHHAYGESEEASGNGAGGDMDTDAGHGP